MPHFQLFIVFLYNHLSNKNPTYARLYSLKLSETKKLVHYFKIKLLGQDQDAVRLSAKISQDSLYLLMMSLLTVETC